MLGAIAGDVIGSIYEFRRPRIKSQDFPLFSPGSEFTDDSVLTVAVADALLHAKDYARTIKEYALRYPHAGYGGMFRAWMHSESLQPFNSFGNGSAMRVSPVGWAFSSPEETLREAERSAAVTHNHPEGIKGAQATALAIFRARTGSSQAQIREEISRRFGYNLGRSLDEIRPGYSFDETCQGSVPESISAFLESSSFEDAIRKAISLGGDTDTMAAIAGGIAEAYYGPIEPHIVTQVRARLPLEFLEVLDAFRMKYVAGSAPKEGRG